MSHGNDEALRIFAASAVAVRVALVKALIRMRIEVSTIASEAGEYVIAASSDDRQIDVRIKSLGIRSSRLRISAHRGGQMDLSTMVEVIAYTERLLVTPAPQPTAL